MMKLNQEQLEARQAELNKSNSESYAKMTEEEKAKINAVDQAMTILTEAGVKTWIFPMLPNKNCTVETMSQYNNCVEFLEFPNGVASEEDSIQLCLFNGCLALSVIGPYFKSTQNLGVKEGDGLVEATLNMFYDSAMVGSKHIWENRVVKD